jgi:Chain length determinant protein
VRPSQRRVCDSARPTEPPPLRGADAFAAAHATAAGYLDKQRVLCKHSIVGTEADPAPVRDLSDYARPLRRRWRWVAIGVALGVALGLAAAALVHHDYTSTASVVVTPTGVQQDVNNANGRTQDEINLDTEAQIVKSDAVAARVRRALHARASLATIERRASVTVPANTTVLRISYTAESPRRAAAGAQAFATAYLAVRASTAARLLRSQEAAVRKQIASVADELALRNAQTSGTTRRERSLRALRYRALAAESAALARQLSTRSTTVVTPGRVIAGATTPSGGAGRTWLLFVLSGAMIGLLLGAGGAVARDRTDTRLSQPRELEDAGIRVVGAVDTPSNAMRTYTRAGNAILGTSPDRRGVVLVAGPTWEPRDNDVALKVATAIRDAASSVALVRVADGTAEMTQLGVRGEIMAGDLAGDSPELSAALAEAARGELRHGVERLKKDFDFVVVDAADPLAEAALPVCDTALLVVSIDATRVPDVVDAAREMERSGVRVLGAVVAPGGRRSAFARTPRVLEADRAEATAGSDALAAPKSNSSQA